MIPLLARRELPSLFCSPIAWVVLVIFSIGTSVWFIKGFHPGDEATLRPTLGFATLWMLPFLAPAVSMRMLSEEFRTGTARMRPNGPIYLSPGQPPGVADGCGGAPKGAI